ncbi:MAG: hypothetical protein GF403_07930 [Candidatus Coatesbacteria bacterium]|nr:hypothetical protein [Candidatus Coatesbacteria bacterium]
MRRTLLILLGVLAAATLAQSCPGVETTAGDGFFLRLSTFDPAELNPEFSGVLMGVGNRGFGTINDWLRIGGGGVTYFLVGNDSDEVDVSFTYGGFILEPYLRLNEHLALSFPVMTGGGGYSFELTLEDEGDNRYYVERYSGTYFLVEPVVELTYQPTACLGFNIHGGYSLSFGEEDYYPGAFFAGVGVYYFGLPER